MTQPGSPASAMPADEATTQRRIADLERQMRELGPSIAASFESTVARVVAFDSIGDSGTGFSISTSQSTKASGSAVVPEGFNSVTVLAVANVTVYNSAGGPLTVYARAGINGSAGGSGAHRVEAGAQGQVSASAIRTTSVTGGDTVTVQGIVYAGTSWPADGLNICNIDAILLFRKV